MMNAALRGKPDAGNPHVRFDEGEVVSEKPRRGSLLYTREEAVNSGWAVSTLESALWAFNTTQSFKEGMIAAVNLGGDSDTIGAVFGQLAGAYYGFEAIPEGWVKAVKDWEKIDERIESFILAVQA